MFDLSLINKYRKIIMGFAILWVMFLHCYADLMEELHVPVIAFIFAQGNLGVELFLFLSGIGLYYSMSKDSAPLPFYWRRIKRVVLPWLIMSCPYWVLKTLIVDHEGIGAFLLNLTGLSFWMDGITTVWYVAFILTMYFIYPLIFNIQSKKSSYLLVLTGAVFAVNLLMLLFCPDYYAKTEIAFTRIPIFLLGSYTGEILKKKSWDKTKQTGFLLYTAVMLSFYILGVLSYNYGLKLLPGDFDKMILRFGGQSVTFLLIAGICLLSEKLPCVPIQKAFSFLGEITLEAYLLHVFLGNIGSRTGFATSRGNGFFFLVETLIIIVSIVAASLFSKIFASVLKKIESKNAEKA